MSIEVQVRPGFLLAIAAVAASFSLPLWAQTIRLDHSLPLAAGATGDSQTAQQPLPPYSAPAPTPSQAPLPSYPVPRPAQTPGASVPPANANPIRVPAYDPYDPGFESLPDRAGSVYIPLDSWIYAEMVRLYELGYVDTMFLGQRPWTRRSVLHMLHESQDDIAFDGGEEAKGILDVMLHEMESETQSGSAPRPTVYGAESLYARLLGISGTPLRDSYHLGQTIANDYGRPYQEGFNAIAGFSTIAETGRFSLYVRGEYQYAPSATGYSLVLANQLSQLDGVGPYQAPNAPQDTIPAGPIAAQNSFRIVEANFSYHVLSHEFSFGKSDAWTGPAAGAAMAWSNNAENIYSFRIDRVEPLRIPLLSRLVGPIRYDFFYGSLKGHTSPNSPYIHSESVDFSPTRDFQFGFERSIIFGGEGHAPVTLHTFLKGFFSNSNTTAAEKNSRDDPGARFSSFHMSYRLPFVRNYATLYVDSLVHDDVSPIDAPRRAAFRTGIDLSHIPGLNKLELRAEGVTTDPGVSRSEQGLFIYDEGIQKQGYTNKGYILGDWIGREAKGGQAWATYHLKPQEWVQFEYLNKKNAKDFAGGTTQNQFKLSVVKRFQKDIELNGWVQYEAWKAPIYKTGRQTDTTAAAQITWYPKLHTTDLMK